MRSLRRVGAVVLAAALAGSLLVAGPATAATPVAADTDVSATDDAPQTPELVRVPLSEGVETEVADGPAVPEDEATADETAVPEDTETTDDAAEPEAATGDETAPEPEAPARARAQALTTAPVADPLPDALADAEVREVTISATVLGLSWDGSAPEAAAISALVDGTWGEWTEVELDGDEVEQDRGEPATEGVSTEVLVGDAEAVRVAVVGSDVADLELLALDAPADDADATVGETASTDAWGEAAAAGSPVARAAATAPAVISRASWGASSAIPNASCAQPEIGSRLERFVIHHTAGTNSYTAADSARLLRGIQAYHVQARGWCDIGYNILVDKYGQIFEGRRGGLGNLVVGVHASGYNTNTVGISVMGDYTTAAPTTAAINAVSAVVGWKSYLHGFNPAGSSVKNGRQMAHVIGHRDVSATACPGAIYGYLGTIATNGRAQSLAYVPAISGASVAPSSSQLLTGSGVTARGTVPVASSWTVSVGSSSGTLRSWSGSSVKGASFSAAWSGSFGLGLYIAPGSYPVTVSARSALGTAYSATLGTATFTQPSSFVAAARSDVLTASTAATAAEELTLPVDVGVADEQVSALVLRVRATSSTAVDLWFSPGSQAIATPVLYQSSAQGAALMQVVAGTNGSGTVTVSRPAGSGAFAVDVVGYVRAPQDGLPYWDVPASFEFADDIAWLSGRGVTTGNADGTFLPASAISRQAMAAFLYRQEGSPSFTAPSSPTFADVPTTHPFYREIEWLAAEGVAEGTATSSGRMYLPSSAVSRQAMAAFLARLADARLTTGASGFPDVPSSSPFSSHVRWLASTGITRGYSDGTFRPTAPVTRQAMAAFLHRYDEL